MKIFALILIIFGYLLRLYSMRTLGGNFHWRIINPKKLIVSGIYKYIRHPMYIGTIIMYVGMVFFSTENYLLTLTMLSIIITFVLDRIDREECLLSNIYGDQYIEYCNKTPMLIPSLFFKKQR